MLKTLHAEEISELHRKISQIQCELGESEALVDQLREQLTEARLPTEPASIATKDGRRYNENIR